MVTSKDSYLLKLDLLATEIESYCGLQAVDPTGQALHKKGIGAVVDTVSASVKTISAEDTKRVNIACGKATLLVAYVSQRLRFYQKRRLDYSVYPHVDVVAEVLVSFLKKNTINDDSWRNLNKIICVLEEIENNYVNYRFALGYRYLRIFLVFILYGNYCNASVIASFILEQLLIEGA